jgi:hypothetical protein
VLVKKKDFMRKFRVQFLASKAKSGDDNCLQCVNELNKFFEIISYDKNEEATGAAAAAVAATESKAKTSKCAADHSDDHFNQDSLSLKDLTRVGDIYFPWHLSFSMILIFNLNSFPIYQDFNGKK